MSTSLTTRRYSHVGRPRRVTNAMIEDILRWHASRRTLRAKAASLGLSPGTVAQVIRTKGTHYKQAPP